MTNLLDFVPICSCRVLGEPSVKIRSESGEENGVTDLWWKLAKELPFAAWDVAEPWPPNVLGWSNPLLDLFVEKTLPC